MRHLVFVTAVAVSLIAPASGRAQADLDYDQLRARMVTVIELHAAVVNGNGEIRPPGRRVLEAMGKVERHRFVPEELAPLAYLDTPLPVGYEQNIAQPYIVALMTELAEIGPGDRVFETGTGAGYQAAILAELGATVFSVEIVDALAERAANTLLELGYRGIDIRIADGYDGWPEAAPFDAMLIKESVVDVPYGLIAQLKPGGRMVVPIGPPEGQQYLTVLSKDSAGAVTRQKIMPVRFSPFQGGQRT